MADLQAVRGATLDDLERLVRISAAAFYDDPVLSWVFPDSAVRLEQLGAVFNGLVRDYLPDRGTVHLLDDASAAFWRTPAFPHGQDSPGDAASASDEGSATSPFPSDVVERLGALDQAMTAAHPHQPHWYLNVLATLPARQGHGLGARVLTPVLERCDADGMPAYLESSNPRNITLYRRVGFEPTGEIPLPDGPSLYPMWRDPR